MMIALDMISATTPKMADSKGSLVSEGTKTGADFRDAMTKESRNTKSEKANKTSSRANGVRGKGANTVEKMTDTKASKAVPKASTSEVKDSSLAKATKESSENTKTLAKAEAAKTSDIYDLSVSDLDVDPAKIVLTPADYDLASSEEMTSDLSLTDEVSMLDENADKALPLNSDVVSANNLMSAVELDEAVNLDDKASLLSRETVDLTKEQASILDGSSVMAKADVDAEAVVRNNGTYNNQDGAKEKVMRLDGDDALAKDSDLASVTATKAQDVTNIATSRQNISALGENAVTNGIATAQNLASSKDVTSEKSGAINSTAIGANANNEASTIFADTEALVESEETVTTPFVNPQNIKLKARATSGIRMVSVEQAEALAKAREAGLRVTSQSGDDSGNVLVNDAGDTLSLMVKMQQAVRSSTSDSVASSSFVAQVLRRAEGLKGEDTAKDEVSALAGDEGFNLFTDESTLGMDEEALLAQAREGELANVSETVIHAGADVRNNDAFAGVMSNSRMRAAVLSGTANTSSQTQGFLGNDGTNGTNGLRGDIFGRVELFGGDSSGNAERIHDQVMKMAARNLRQVELELYPRNLGKLKIAVSVEDGNRAAVSFTASSKAAKELLGESMPKLKDYMAAAGMELTDQSVESSGDAYDGQQGHESSGYDRARQAWHDSLTGNHQSANEAWADIFGESDGGFKGLNSAFGGLKIAGM